MKFYRLSKWETSEGSQGYEFFTSKHAAQRARLAWCKENEEPVDDNINGLDILEIAPTKQGILAALNRWASHPDNG